LLLPVSKRVGELALRYRLPGTGLHQYLVSGLLETYGAANLPEPQDPADLADAMWDLYLKRDRFDQVFGA
jgi:hypothetical protein